MSLLMMYNNSINKIAQENQNENRPIKKRANSQARHILPH